MAEMDAALAIENAVEQLKQEADTLERVHKMKSLRSDLRSMSSLLRKFDGQENDPKVEEQLQEVRDIAYKAQDEIESIVLETELQDRKGKLGKLFSGKSTLKHHLETMGDIEKRVQRICSLGDAVGSVKVLDPNPDIIGNGMVKFRESQESLVTQQLISGALQRQVILIFGKAGLGKTTLAEKVYNNTEIHAHFSCHWVGMPRESQVGATLRRILQQTSPITQVDCQTDDAKLMHELYESLKGRTYLIVLDNLSDSEVFDAIMSSFPDDLNGSRILVTSRLEPAYLSLSNNLLSYQVTPLDTSQSWELLSGQAFRGANCCPSNLEELGKRMVDTCKGSPRAIMSLAKILEQAEKTEETWRQFELDLNQGKIWDYADLPRDQLLCFLYMGIFPAGLDILAKQITQMWAAEGLLERKGNREVEETGENCLNKLSRRSFIQAGTPKMGDDTIVKTYRISNFASHLCRTIGADKFSLEVVADKNVALGVGKQTVRLGILNTSISVLKIYKQALSLRSLNSFGKSTEPIPNNSVALWKTLHHKFSRLRVLNMGSLKLDGVPKVIGELIHLRYLRLVAPSVTHVPSSFGKLHNLETLDMRETHLRGRLHGIWKMKHLRHIYLRGFSMPDPHSIDYYKALLNLQTLTGVHPDRILKRLMVRAKFPNIKRLRLCSLDRQVAFTFLNSLDHLYYLRSLRIEKPTNIPDDSNAFPSSLSKLTLLETRLQPDCIKKTLEKLPNLKVLKLLNESITGRKIKCTAGGFPQLEVLCLKELVLEKLQVEDAMPHLKYLYIKSCRKLESPIALQSGTIIYGGDF